MVKRTDDEGGVDLELVQKEYEKENANRGRFAPKDEGTYNIRILPPLTRGLYYAKFGVHYEAFMIARGAPSDRRAVACLRDTLQQFCPLCQAVDGMYAQSRLGPTEDKATLAIAGKTRAKLRYVMNVVDMDATKLGVLTWEVGKDAHALIQPIFKRWHDITRPDWDRPKSEQQGQVLEVTFTKREKWNVVTNVQPTGENSPIEVKNWRELRKDLDAYVQALIVPADELRAWLTDRSNDDIISKPSRGRVVDVEVGDGEAGMSGQEEEDAGEDGPLDPGILQDPELQKLEARIGRRR